MILTKDSILAEIGVSPLPDFFQVNPHSLDLRVDHGALIAPGMTVVLKSLESITLPGDVMGVVYPRSSTNRRGLEVHMTGLVDANYSGTLMIPVTNHTSEMVNIKTGERIASIVFQRLEKQAALRLSKYHGKDGSYVPDKTEETAFLDSGDIVGLKIKFALSQAE